MCVIEIKIHLFSFRMVQQLFRKILLRGYKQSWASCWKNQTCKCKDKVRDHASIREGELIQPSLHLIYHACSSVFLAVTILNNTAEKPLPQCCLAMLYHRIPQSGWVWVWTFATATGDPDYMQYFSSGRPLNF